MLSTMPATSLTKTQTRPVMLFWDEDSEDFVVFDGEKQEVTNDTLLHIVGHGGDANSIDQVRLGGYGPKKLAWLVSRLPLRNRTIGHISLVACYIHRRADGNSSYLRLFLSDLFPELRHHYVSQCVDYGSGRGSRRQAG